MRVLLVVVAWSTWSPQAHAETISKSSGKFHSAAFNIVGNVTAQADKSHGHCPRKLAIRSVRVGISLSLTGSWRKSFFWCNWESNHRCTWCHSVRKTLLSWRDVSNERGKRVGINNTEVVIVDLRIKDDRSNETAFEENFRSFIDGGIDYLLGPSTPFWNAKASKLAEIHRKPLFLWAMLDSDNMATPFYSTTQPSQLPARRLNEILHDELNEVNDFKIHRHHDATSETGLVERSSFSSQLHGTERKLQNDACNTAVCATGCNFTFDLNIPLNEWAKPAINQVASLAKSGHTHREKPFCFVFLWWSGWQFSPGDAARCSAYRDYVISISNVTAFLADIDLRTSVMSFLQVFQYARPDAIVFCGLPKWFKLLLIALKSHRITVAAIIADRPVPESVAQELDATTMNYVIDVFPTALFNTSAVCFRNFVSHFNNPTNQTKDPKISAVQARAATSLIDAAVMSVPSGSQPEATTAFF